MKTKLIAVAALCVLCSASQALANHEGNHDWMTKCDTNGDGYISRTEFLSAKGNWFDEMDRNRDGRLDSEERTMARNDMSDDGMRAMSNTGMKGKHPPSDREWSSRNQ